MHEKELSFSYGNIMNAEISLNTEMCNWNKTPQFGKLVRNVSHLTQTRDWMIYKWLCRYTLLITHWPSLSLKCWDESLKAKWLWQLLQGKEGERRKKPNYKLAIYWQTLQKVYIWKKNLLVMDYEISIIIFKYTIKQSELKQHHWFF